MVGQPGLCAPLPTLRRHPRGCPNARLGADAVCYSFIVVNLHHYSLPVSTGAPEFEFFAAGRDVIQDLCKTSIVRCDSERNRASLAR